MQVFPPLTLTFPDRQDWIMSRVLEHRARTHGDLPWTPNNKIQKHLLRRAGVTDSTWDRERAGYKLQEEIKKAAARTGRRATS